MAKKQIKTKKSKKKLTILGKVSIVFTITFLGYIFSSVIIKANNVSLHYHLLELQDEITATKSSIDEAQQEIIRMKDQEYVMAILKDEGLHPNNDAVYVIGE